MSITIYPQAYFSIGATSGVWYAGEVASVVSPTIIADGDLATATDQVPLYWRAVINAADQATAAQQLLSGTDVLTLNPGDTVVATGLDSDASTVHAICFSTSSSAPANYTGGAYIVSGGGATYAAIISNMAEFDFSGAVGARQVMITASQVYNTNFAQLTVHAGA